MSKSILKSVALAGTCIAIGVGLGATFLAELKDESAILQDDDSAAYLSEIQRLKASLANAQSKIKQLQEEDLLAARPKKRTTALPAISLPDTADAQSKAVVAKLNERIADLQSELEAEKKKTAPLTDEEMATKVQELKDKFNDAFAQKDGQAALKAMKELAKLDSRAFEARVELWAKMEKNKWLGLGWRERRGWSSPELFHWALSPEGMKIADPKMAKEFRKTAVWLLAFSEDDPSKKAKTFANFLGTLPLPTELTDEQKKARQGRRRWEADSDLYRASLRSIARIPSDDSAQILTGLVNNNAAPNDVRLIAVRGLARQKDDASLQALKFAANDGDPDIRRTAEVGLIRRDPPVQGYLITDVTKNSQAAGLGLEAGSIITGADGKTMKPNDIFQKIYKSKDPVMVSVYKKGVTQTYKFKGGQRLGVNGDEVSPKAN
ncbi:MAG: hypothetical protein P1V97_32330 [Planctomycetota bacterium]|nr:hypothetical protein [Planctomycetota bacterium]